MIGVDQAPAAVARRPTHGMIRTLRVTSLGGVSLVLAAGAHLAGGGQLPSAGILVMTALFLGLLAVMLTARQCRIGVLLTAMLVQQTLLHLLFDAAANVGAGCGAKTTAGLQHTAHAALAACDPSAMSSMGSTGQLSSWGMWFAHVAATVVTAGLLARGEAWLWRVADQIVQAASATPGGSPEPARLRVFTTPPMAPAEPGAYSPAEPRAPPLVLAVL